MSPTRITSSGASLNFYIGWDTADITKSLYDLLSSGVALEDSTKALELAAKAATPAGVRPAGARSNG